MSNLEKLQPFDPAAAVNAIRDKIRGAMLDVIPDEQWTALIQAEVVSFTTDRVERHYTGDRTHPAGFKLIVRELLEKDLRERVAKMLQGPEWAEQWDSQNRPLASAAVQKYITENAGQIMSAWLAGAVQAVVSQLPYQAHR